MLKRFSALLLALSWALTLTACGQLSGTAPLPAHPDPAPSAALTESPGPAPSAQTDQGPETAAPASQAPESAPPAQSQEPEAPAVSKEGRYSSKEDVALYIHLYGHLPGNYLTKREAEALGWSGGSVERYAGEGAALGGSRFGNYEGLLPEKEGRTYTECDIDTVGRSSRGPKRIVFSNDGLVYYTGDHYESFELLYGEE